MSEPPPVLTGGGSTHVQPEEHEEGVAYGQPVRQSRFQYSLYSLKIQFEEAG